jgi:2-polyprenyl-3-methyl-5-hydroxy-6-metoxy-1,4-benzoquinol methylase
MGVFEPEGRKGKWFEEKYYTYLFTRNKHYSSPEPNEEEKQRWEHIEELVKEAQHISHKPSFVSIIDFGCGRGWLSKELSSYGIVTGIEPVSKVVEYGRKIYPGLDLRRGDLKSLGQTRSDLIVSSEVIEHLGRNGQSEYFTAFYNALEPGGFLIITTPRMEAFPEWSKYVDLDQPTEEWLTEPELKELAEDAGFQVLKKIVYGRRPRPDAPVVEIYQQWLFRR